MQVFFTFGLMFEFDSALVSRPRTFSSFTADHEQLYAKHGAKFVSKTTFLQAWWRWNALLDLDFDIAFSCPKCDKLPASERLFIMDGTHLGLKSSELKLADFPPPLETTLGCLDTSARLMVDDKTMRDVLLEFSQRDLTPAELKSMTDRCEQHASWLNACVKLLLQRNCTRAPTVLQRLFRAVSCATPTSGFILRPASTLPALTALAAGENVRSSPALWSLLIDNCPCLASLVSDPALDAELMATLRPVFERFASACKSLTSELPAQFQHIAERVDVSAADDLARGCCFGPAMRAQRPLHSYAADRQSHNADDDCKRVPGRRHQALSPGIFTVFCEHGICLGFQLLRDPESERVPFQMFYTRLDSCKLDVLAQLTRCECRSRLDCLRSRLQTAYLHAAARALLVQTRGASRRLCAHQQSYRMQRGLQSVHLPFEPVCDIVEPTCVCEHPGSRAVQFSAEIFAYACVVHEGRELHAVH
jgi:hypothetical protein